MKQKTLINAKPQRIFHDLRSGEVVPIFYDFEDARKWRRGKPPVIQRAQNRAQQRHWATYFEEKAKDATDRLLEEATGGFVVGAGPQDIDIDEGIDWIEQLIIPTGPAQGSRMFLMDWQKDWIRGVMAPGIRTGGLSVSRKNAKTLMNCAVALAHLAGPWHRPNWAGMVLADKLENANVFHRQLRELAGASGLMNVMEFKKKLAVGKDGAELTMLAADRHGSGHATNADIAWIDECGALGANDRPMYEAMFTSISARDGKFFAVGNQREGPMFREIEAKADLPHVHWRRYTTPREADITNEDAWRLGNPGLGVIKPVSFMRERAADALLVPATMSYFRSFDLNQAIDPERVLIVQEAEWLAIEERESRVAGERVVAGVDMGGTESMTAMAVLGLDSGVLECWAGWGDHQNLLERGRRDGVDTLYLDMEQRGELKIYDMKMVPGGQFIWDVMRILDERGCQLVRLGADRKWRTELVGALTDSGYRGVVELRGTGGGSAWMDGATDVRAFQRVVLDKLIKAPPSLLLRNAIVSSTLDINVRGNASLDKGNNRNSRIDALQAAVIAAGLWEREKRTAREVWIA